MKESVLNRMTSSHWHSLSSDGLFTDIISIFKRFTTGNSLPEEKIITIPFETAVASEIIKKCNGSDLLIYNFYTSVLGILLSKYCDRETLMLLTPALYKSGLPPGYYQYVHFNTVPEASFKTLFSKGKEQLVVAMDHAIEETELIAIWSRQPHFAAEVGCTVSNITAPWGQLRPAITIEINTDAAAPAIVIRFDSQLFYAELLELFVLNYVRLLTTVVRDLYTPVDTLNFQSDKELALLHQFNTPVNTFPVDRHMVAEIEERVMRIPDHIALVFEDRQVSYHSLNERANKIAHFLLNEYKVSANELIGVLMDRSDVMAAAILGIWKAGAAYVPIDLTYPAERIREIITNSRVAAILGNNLQDDDLLQSIKAYTDWVDLDKMHDRIARYPGTNPGISIKMDDLAYVIYTSGTTGKPKGVMIEHFGMRNHIGAKIADLKIREACRIAQNAPHCFDISVWQYFAALICGGTTFIYSNNVVLETAAFMRKIAEDEIQVLELVPSYFSLMLDVLEDEQENYTFPALECLLLQAEPLLPSMVKRWYRLFPEITIYNAYGITETSDDIAHYEVSAQESTLTIPVSKRTIQHAHIYLVNEHMRPVPIGAKGEILVAGNCVGRGYHNNPEQTASRFLKGPDLEKRYLSGDIARYLADGRLEFFGRKDAQVKIRGQRVEPGEIEVVMSAIAGIDHAVVLADTINQRLHAYYTGTPLQRDFLENELKLKLPEYMIPSAFMRVDEFPLTANGKIDRKRLCELSEQISEPTSTGLDNTDTLTLQVIEIWKDVFKREHISVQDDFFQLGGHSLSVMKLANIYTRAFNVKLPVSVLFECRTIKEHVHAIYNRKEGLGSILRVQEQESYELSDAQRRLWILSRFDKGGIAYNVPLTIRIKGKLDIPAFEKAIYSVIERHEILRTVFRENEEGVPRQYVLENWNADIEIYDLRESVNKEAVAIAYQEQLAGFPFDLGNGPLYKAWLLRLEEEKYLFCFNLHHIICDGWSLNILVNETWTYYRDYLQGKTPVLSALAFQYKDFAAWQKTFLESGQLMQHRNYWLDKLSGDLPVLDLPAYQSRPAIKTYKGSRGYWEVPAETVQGMKLFCQQQNGTLYVGLLAVVYGVLARYTGQQDIILGSPVTGREHPELHDQIGFYVNSLALRVQLDMNKDFLTLFNNVRETVTEALHHQVYPFDVLIDDLKPERDASRSPLFDVVVVFDSAVDNNRPNLPNQQHLELEYVKEDHANAKFDLNIMFSENSDGIGIAITFNSDLYKQAFVERMGNHILQFMKATLTDSSVPLNKVDYLTTQEKEHLLPQGTKAFQHPITVRSVVDRFQEQVEYRALFPAVICGEQTFTYHALNERANHIAHWLIKRKPGNDIPIGIYLDRGIDYVCAILGILKAGGCYLPLDINYPAERTKYLLQDSGAHFIITNTTCLQDQLQEDEYTCLLLDRDATGFQDESGVNPEINISADSTAYVIYTSGTTGMPKGVMVSHGNLAALFDAAHLMFDFHPQDVWTLFHAFSFDFSVWELFGPLLSGAKVVVIPEAVAKDTVQFVEVLQMQQVTVLNQTPSAGYALMEVLKKDTPAPLPDLRYLIFGGEALHPGRLLWWKRQYPAVRNINMYGITETTVHVTFKEIGEPEIINNVSTVGLPLPQWTCYVLDEWQQPVPVGIPGELYVGGAGVTKGYYNREALTKERFIEHPAIPGTRLYRTGDKVKIQENGELEFVSRVDNQVKIRGYRIELGEIESILLKSGFFTDVKVRAIEAGQDKELVTYYVDDNPLDVVAARNYLRKFLPQHMLPAYFIRLDKMPVTANGKLDEKALPAITYSQRVTTAEYVAPENDTEKKLATIWKQILNIEKIGIYDNFFESGGHSLKATMLLTEIHKQFSIKLKLDDIFSDPTISGLAALIQNVQQLLSSDASDGKRKIII